MTATTWTRAACRPRRGWLPMPELGEREALLSADYDDVSDPEWLAETIVKQVGGEVASLPAESGSAECAAAMSGELL